MRKAFVLGFVFDKIAEIDSTEFILSETNSKGLQLYYKAGCTKEVFPVCQNCQRFLRNPNVSSAFGKIVGCALQG